MNPLPPDWSAAGCRALISGSSGRGNAGSRRGRGTAVGGVDQLGDLLELAGAESVAAGLGQVPGDVEDRLLAVVERAADVEANPGLGVVFHLVGGLVTVARATSSTSEGVLDRRRSDRGGHGGEVATQHQGRRHHDDGFLGEQLLAQRAPARVSLGPSRVGA